MHVWCGILALWWLVIVGIHGMSARNGPNRACKLSQKNVTSLSALLVSLLVTWYFVKK